MGFHMETAEEEIENRLLEISDTKNYSGWSLIIVSAIGMMISFLPLVPVGLLVSVILLVSGIALVVSSLRDRRMVVARHQSKEEDEQLTKEEEKRYMPVEEGESKKPSSEDVTDTKIAEEKKDTSRYEKPLSERFPELFPGEKQRADAGGKEPGGDIFPAPASGFQAKAGVEGAPPDIKDAGEKETDSSEHTDEPSPLALSKDGGLVAAGPGAGEMPQNALRTLAAHEEPLPSLTGGKGSSREESGKVPPALPSQPPPAPPSSPPTPVPPSSAPAPPSPSAQAKREDAVSPHEDTKEPQSPEKEGPEKQFIDGLLQKLLIEKDETE